MERNKVNTISSVINCTFCACLIVSGCSYSGGFVKTASVVIHLGKDSKKIQYSRSVSGVAKASPSYCVPSAPIPLYKKAMERLHKDAKLGPNEILMNIRQDLVRRQTGNAVCRLALVLSADVYKIGTSEGVSNLTKEEGGDKKKRKLGRQAERKQEAQKNSSVMKRKDSKKTGPKIISIFPSAGESGVWVQLRGMGLNRIKTIWLVGPKKQWRILKTRTLSKNVILIRIPKRTTGGFIGYSIGDDLKRTDLRYDVVTDENVASLRSRMKPKSLGRTNVKRTLKGNISSLRQCRKEGVSGRRVYLRITVSGTSGVVKAVEIQGDTDSSLDEKCVIRFVKKLVFPMFRLNSASVVVGLIF